MSASVAAEYKLLFIVFFITTSFLVNFKIFSLISKIFIFSYFYTKSVVNWIKNTYNLIFTTT